MAAPTVPVTSSTSTNEELNLALKENYDNIEAHKARDDNPHGVTKAQVGLGNVDNTSDAAKPISTAMQTALDARLATAMKATPEQALAGASTTHWVAPDGLAAMRVKIARDLQQAINFELTGGQHYAATMPGLVPLHYATTVEGPVSVLAESKLADVVMTPRGPAYRLYGAGLVARREPMVLNSGRKWKITAVIRRALDSSDPLGDALRVSVYWLNSGQTAAGMTATKTVLNADAVDIVAADGWVTVSAVVAQSDLSGVDHFNGEAVFARAVVEQAGGADTPHADVLWLGAVDITDAEVVTDVAGDIDARVTTLEARTPFAAMVQPEATDLDTLTSGGHYYVASPVNAPAAAASIVGVEVAVIDANTARQEIWDAAGNDAHRFWRHRISGTWGQWYELASREYVDGAIADLANSIGPGTSGDLTPTIVAPDATGLVVTYGAARGGRYVWSSDGMVTVYGTVQFSVDYSGGASPVYIGGLPVAARVTQGVVACPCTVKPAGNWVYPANHKATLGHIQGNRPDEIQIGFEAADTGGASERLNYALSQLPTATTFALAFSATYEAVSA